MAVGCIHVQLYAMFVVGCNNAQWSGVTGGLPQKVWALRRIIARFPSCGELSPGECRGGRNARNPPGVPVRIVLPQASKWQLCEEPARCSCKGSPARDKKSERRRRRHRSSRTGDNNIDGGDDMYQHSSYVTQKLRNCIIILCLVYVVSIRAVMICSVGDSRWIMFGKGGHVSLTGCWKMIMKNRYMFGFLIQNRINILRMGGMATILIIRTNC